MKDAGGKSYEDIHNTLWKTIGGFLGTLYFKLNILCAAPLYSLYNDNEL